MRCLAGGVRAYYGWHQDSIVCRASNPPASGPTSPAPTVNSSHQGQRLDAHRAIRQQRRAVAPAGRGSRSRPATGSLDSLRSERRACPQWLTRLA